MTKFPSFIALALSVVIAIVMFHIKYKVVDLENQLANVHNEIFLAEESIHLLRSEWAYLNSPDRLQELASNELQMIESHPVQLVSMERFSNMPSIEEDYEGFETTLISMRN